MTGMYIAEGTRRGLIPGRTVIVVLAHLVEKWRRDLRRYFAIDADRLTPELARDPKDLDPRVSVWVVSVDLFTYYTDVRRKVAGARASWSLAVFDEAHRLTPTSQYLTAARELSVRTHHLLLLTATPHPARSTSSAACSTCSTRRCTPGTRGRPSTTPLCGPAPCPSCAA